MLDGDLEEVSLAQAFTQDYAHLAVTVVVGNHHEVWLVTSARQLCKVTLDAITVGGNHLVRGNQKEYASLVKPRWRKASLQAFVHGEHLPDPPTPYQRLKAVLGTLIEFADPIASDIVCCWTIGTYYYRMFDAFPYLGVLGPKGSGKTKLAQVIEEVAFNPLRTDSITPAQLFRSVEVTGGTLILDEQESVGGNFSSDDRLAILRGGYKQGGNALRSKGESGGDYSTQAFDSYGPKVIINTTGMEELLADRCIAIHMLRSTGPQGMALVSAHEADLKAVRDELYCLALEVFREVGDAYRNPDFGLGLNNRQRERWLPILAVARTFSPDRLADLEAAALQDNGSTILADQFDAVFLQAIDALVNQPTEELGTNDIGERMQRILDLEWPVKSAKVGRLIRKYLGDVGRRSGPNGSYRYIITRQKVDNLLKLYPIN